jgi:KDO2-lipid IV(A) lauroyltransferase
MKNITYFLSYIILRITCAILSILPLSFTYFIARQIGNFTNFVLHYRYKVVMENLTIAFGNDLNEKKRAEIAAESYRQTAMSFMELLVAPKLKKQINSILQPEHFALIQNLLQQQKGLVAISGHLGNWELQGAAVATIMTEPLTVAAVQQSNPYINRFITRRRREMGMEVAGTKEAMKLLLKALKNRQAIGLVADQSGGRDAVFVDFFGHNAATQSGPAKLALKFGAPMMVAAAVRTSPGKFTMLAQQVEIKKDDTVESLTQRHVKILESFIRQYPEQYFWLHRRWKRRPPEELKI